MILITGANGFVGHKLMELCKDTAASPSLQNVTQEMVNRMIKESNADVVVHTAAISDLRGRSRSIVLCKCADSYVSCECV